ncbi:unnamed protein product [Paramecium primaurelia]|uniref:Uncharacterized protein n=4 Tax=Paramecium TaxID=5884 RepID=A0D8Y2_PARTE|nr:uncharacterized protein GSPATT00014445001 [Paramecium tetraurelia]CAD8074673.1 unnamed protein product [Paramecium primaurelia]CAD8167023.1 unnamed protein product [Paramecium pentaurelia]CAD8176679.1 unnamed protein product [Paramecium octaurelia]CAK79499.1 unnamed protein product [Paramecium tetraurelia]|eukprot:XP_001446896.1 hypothetical protein (macronuclear) [Paramecium tetraurelia strain d4-2]
MSFTYLPFHNLAYCPKQVIEFVQNPNLNLQDLNHMIEQLRMPKNHLKAIQKMQILASRQEQFLQDENTMQNQEEEIHSPKQLLSQIPY